VVDHNIINWLHLFAPGWFESRLNMKVFAVKGIGFIKVIIPKHFAAGDDLPRSIPLCPPVKPERR
jgi:hypothetical protein